MPDPVERRTLAACAFIASLLLFPLGGRITSVMQILRDRIAALSALTIAALLLLFHLVMSRREAARAEAALPAGASGSALGTPQAGAEPVVARAEPPDEPAAGDEHDPGRAG